MAVKKRKALLIDDYHLLSYEELDSTNAEARRLAEGGAAHGAFVWALRQTEGRGRRGREWVSQEGNLFTSVLLNPDCPLAQIPQLSFVSAIAALDSLKPLLPEAASLQCKWPNDLLLSQKKLGGILLESFETVEEDECKRWVVIGLGINIDSCPGDTDIPATFLKNAGVELVSAKIVLSRFIHHFIDWYGVWENKGFAAVREHWLKHCVGLGEEIRVQLPEEVLHGRFDSLDEAGNLHLALQGGAMRQIAAGDVFLL